MTSDREAKLFIDYENLKEQAFKTAEILESKDKLDRSRRNFLALQLRRAAE